ncbi:MAG: G8 domain-containing protein, partial [Planctomycetota bacterium]
MRRLSLEALERRRLLHGAPSCEPNMLAPQLFAGSAESGGANASASVAFEVNDDALIINHQETAAVIPSQLLANDVGNSLAILNVFNPVGGELEFRDGVAFYTPGAGHHGATRSFDYRAMDANGTELTATVTLQESGMTHGGPGDDTRRDEHRALFDLIDTDDATNVTIASGNWSDPSIWSAGAIPSTGERALIHHTLEVTYDVQSDAALDWLRVDGVLEFPHDSSTRLVAETIVSDPRATINLGTNSDPIQAAFEAEILIDTTGGALNQTFDPTLVGRGFITHGVTNIHGAPKAEFTTLRGDAFADDAFIELTDASIPLGWQVGDTLLLVGTDVDNSLLNSPGIGAAIEAADAANARFRDELLEVTDFQVVDDHLRVFFNNVTNASVIGAEGTSLLWDHTRPSGQTFDAEELSIHVANLTRNVVVRSSDPTVDLQERGHFMVMHNANAEIHHAQFRDLGRTDKRQIVDDPASIGNFDGSIGTGSNPRGRYGLHLHRLGANQLDGAAASVGGNVVWGSPGWGIVHHDSHAILEDNVVFDVVGAGIVAEDGNELGLWRNNLVVKTTGDLVNNFDDGAFFQTLRGPRFDLGFFGSGYWVQGGGFGIRMEDNIAASTNAAGFDLVHHTDGLANVEYPSVDLIEDPQVRQAFIDAGFDFVTPNNVPTRGIDGLIFYNGFRGIHTWLHNRDSGDMEGTFSFPIYLSHEFRSTIENYTIWGVQSGIQNFYSTRFDFVDGLVVGNAQSPVPLFIDPVQQGNNTTGLGIGHNHEEANHNRFDGLRLEGFEYGFQVFSPFNEVRGEVTPYATSEIRRAEFANVTHAFIPTNAFNPASQQHRLSDLFVIDEESSFDTLDDSNVVPTASFSSTGAGGLAITLDASESFDPDPSPQVRVGDDGIAAYAWDLDNDGQYDDAFGEHVLFHPGQVGDHTIGLRVWDDDGDIGTTTQTVSVSHTATVNPFVDADFDSGGSFLGEFYRFHSGRRGDGWIARDVIRNPAGFAEIGSPGFGRGSFGQIARDQSVHRGEATFSFDAIALDGLNQANLLQVRLFGVDGQFDLDSQGVPSPIHAMPAPVIEPLIDVNVAVEQLPTWTTQSFDVELGAEGYEYLVIVVQYEGYNVAQGDYFALDNFLLEADARAPQVSSAIVNGGDTQRSRVTELTLEFSELIAELDASAFVLRNTTTNAQFVPVVSTQIIDQRTVATLTFAGAGIEGRSLPDGNYTLRTLSANVTDVTGNALDGNRSGTSGEDAVDTFFRLFGDHDGDRSVGISDFFQFRSAFGPSGTYDSAFDSNDDGLINIVD